MTPEEQTDELLTALFNSSGWVVACARQDRQRQYELIRGVALALIEAEREQIKEFCLTRRYDPGPYGDLWNHALDAVIEFMAHDSLAASASDNSPGGT